MLRVAERQPDLGSICVFHTPIRSPAAPGAWRGRVTPGGIRWGLKISASWWLADWEWEAVRTVGGCLWRSLRPGRQNPKSSYEAHSGQLVASGLGISSADHVALTMIWLGCRPPMRESRDSETVGGCFCQLVDCGLESFTKKLLGDAPAGFL